ncbi:recombinase family protein [Parasphingopyxis lamellibrachiae]|uniref:DNA invertase Pin-like site-specific DNA recombinase n=1 Tax=Parasphingopyxis lamellibrachiae TaxID=680125 RepID=A0A3D9FGP0_9SPHN|nr:recombinase family protein [Parasphingopyxis lamellibrachiae]RED16717.1 DNA invertase Pin-like site-specific DNA recombinase [Parasphingopyxis lamellibrachiae]
MLHDDHRKRKLRCVIYTRKSTEEGLEQEFNSLDAQREACRAYVMSQQHEGWTLDDTLYDDGGYSGGSLDRPALRQILSLVKAKKIDVIVVYKVDRLTRSLADFAKIVEIMDDAGASFVSVTQAFNTTTSMGRLTLNVLLSFAQFEREVTGERIRDKIAASKKKGMWMGGPVPLGYRVQDRKLLIDEAEAEQVRTLFREYLRLGSMRALGERLEELGIRTRVRVYKSGRTVGGCTFAPGSLQQMLRNKVYRGMMVHKGKAWPGEHEAIIDLELWDAVQALVDKNLSDKNNGVRAASPSLLSGIVFDEHGRRLTPSHATRGPRRYRYYVTPTDLPIDTETPNVRVPAHDLEEAVINRLCDLLRSKSELAAYYPIEQIELIASKASSVAQALGEGSPSDRRKTLQDVIARIIVDQAQISIQLTSDSEIGLLEREAIFSIPAVKIKVGQETKLVVGPDAGTTAPNERLVRLIAEGFIVREKLIAGEALDDIASSRGSTKQWTGRLARLGWLAPEIVEAVVSGTQPETLTRRDLSQSAKLPIAWTEQIYNLGARA